MNIKAKVEWIIDDNALGIESGDEEIVIVDSDYVEDNRDAVVEWIETQLSDKYGIELHASEDEDDDGDFVIVDLGEILTELRFEDFNAVVEA